MLYSGKTQGELAIIINKTSTVNIRVANYEARGLGSALGKTCLDLFEAGSLPLGSPLTGSRPNVVVKDEKYSRLNINS